MANWKEMKKKPFFQALGKIAPTIATALGGPFGGLAAGALTAALGLPADASEGQIASKIENATADDIVALRKVNTDFEAKMKELDISEQDLYLKDTQSAREMQREVRSKMPAALAILGWLQWLMVAMVILFGEKFGITLGSEQRDILFFILATSQAMALQGFYFFLGSSRGSKEKTAAFQDYMVSTKGTGDGR